MEAPKESGLMVIKFENQKVPEFKQVRGKDWIYWGEDNSYADYLIGLYDRSSTHQAIISGKVDYIIGNGWKAEKAGLTVNNNAIINAFINKINADETLNELSEAVVLDFELFNGICLDVIWNKSKRDFDLYHIPFNKIRPNEDETKLYYSKDWSITNQSEEKTGLKELKPFDFNKKENGVFRYRITSPRKGKDPNVYPSPGYIGGTQSIETEIECTNYNLSEIKTGFSAGTMINFYNGIPEEEQKKKIRKDINSNLTGTDRGGSWILNFSDGKDRGSEVISLSGNDLPERYINVKEDSQKNIFVSHKVNDPTLFGVMKEGVMFDSKSNSFSQEQFQNQYVTKRQNILEKIFNKFAKLKGISGKLTIQPITINRNDIFTEATIIANLPPKAVQDIIAERMGIDLKKYENVAVVNTTVNTTTEMSKQDNKESDILLGFSKIGRSKSLFNIYKSRELKHLNFFSIAQTEIEYFKNELTNTQRSVIDLLNKEEKTPPSEIAKALKLTEKEVVKIIETLIDGDFLKPTKTGYAPTSDAIDVVNEEGAKTANIEILYSYEFRRGFDKSDLKTSRPFCKELIKLDRLYTRAEIDNLSNGMGLDVWTFKGGWYTNPNTDAPTPQCRHLWSQVIAKLK